MTLPTIARRHPWMRLALPALFALMLLAGFLPALFAKATGDTPAPTEKMTVLQAAILGVVEGVTEYLPVSSTGHMLLANQFLGIGKTPEEKTALEAYIIIIQAGAILAVLFIYWGRVKKMAAGVFGKDADGRRLALNTLIAFLPAAVIGLLFNDRIKEWLFGTWPVVIALFVGGLAIIVFSRTPHGDGATPAGKALEAMTWKQAVGIGLLQCIAMWPGTSRSLMTIVGGLVVGLSVAAAVEFSFLLGLVTLSAATLFDLVKGGREIVTQFGIVNPVIGFLVAGIAAFVSVKWMVGYLTRHSLAVFGWYRVAVAGIFIVLILLGMLKV
ncbi:MAG TPA: undecaprenyl-diphosphate phosphatase [Armatimonadota bacterium]|nr:undecaprenyl-diphosphate phosphatase [Armatimonadota bacterium]